MSYPSKIEDPVIREEVARLTAEGATQAQIAEAVGVRDRGTVAAWQKRDDVRSLVDVFIRENSREILRHVTGAIKKRLQTDKDNMPTELMLKIYERFAPQVGGDALSGDPADAMAAMVAYLDEHPDAAEGLRELFKEAQGDSPGDALAAARV